MLERFEGGRNKSIHSQFFPLITEVTIYSYKITFMKKCAKITSDNLKGLYMKIEREAILENYTLPKKPSKDGYYRTYVNENGKRKQLCAKSIEELSDKIYKFEKDKNSKTFMEVFDLSEKEREKYIIDPEKKLSYINTKAVHYSDYHRFLSGTEFERLPMDAITKKTVEDFIESTLKKFSLRQRAFVGFRYILSTTFKYAFNNYLIIDNVYERIDISKYRQMVCKPTPINKRAYNDSEIIDILECLREKQRKKPSYIAPYAVECQILMGLRRGEIPPLKWSDVKDSYILINKEQLSMHRSRGELNRQVIVNHTKTGKDRVFPIVGESKDFFNKMMDVHNTYYKDSEYIFPSNTTSSGAISNEVIYKCYSKVIKELGIKRDGIVMGTHSFRRNAITDAVNNTGGDLVLVSELFGNSPEVIRKNYFTGIELGSATLAIGKRILTKS